MLDIVIDRDTDFDVIESIISNVVDDELEEYRTYDPESDYYAEISVNPGFSGHSFSQERSHSENAHIEIQVNIYNNETDENVLSIREGAPLDINGRVVIESLVNSILQQMRSYL